ncbi:hypothetical protein Goshw_004570, partial [Gossypium schwendimanii]|nr:hypothetical protein [Gossypium schwendimanii]
FPASVKSINNDDFYYYFHIEISSLIDIVEKEKFYQPYQLWIIQRMIGSPRLSAVKEDREHLKKNIDKCYNNPRYYQTQTGIDLTKAQYLLHQQIYKLWTDGRRILAYDTGNIQNDRDEESLRLLKKIVEMKIEDFPSHIIEEIRSTWETCNS